MRTISLRKGCLHVETPLGIVNITVGLSDTEGRRVESIETIACQCHGEPKVIRRGYGNTRLIELKSVRN
mgnify:CR=1 FL=1